MKTGSSGVICIAVCCFGIANVVALAEGAPPSVVSRGGASSYPLSAYAALGSTMARNSRLVDLGWSDQQINAFVDGVQAAFHGKASSATGGVDELSKAIDHQISEIQNHRRREEYASPAGLARFIKQTRKDANLRETDSGLCFRFLATGVGVRPRPQDTVVVSLDCRSADDLTPLPALAAKELHVKVSDLLPGLAEGLQMMTVDSRVLFLVPPKLSFGEGEWPQGVERGLPLVFVVTLHAVVPAITGSRPGNVSVP